MVEKTLNELKRGRIVKITGRSSPCQRMLNFGPGKNAKTLSKTSCVAWKSR